MARNRVIYQSEGLFSSKALNSTSSGDHRQLKRVQSANYSFEITRQDVNQFGQLARIDALVLQSPTVSLDFSYYLADGFNESALGFYVQGNNTSGAGPTTEGNFASGQMISSSGINFYIVTDSEGIDLNYDNTIGTALSGKGVIGIGNGFITDYTLNAAVGDLPTVSVSVEGLGFCAATYGISGDLTGFVGPAINPALGSKLATGTGDYVKLPLPSTGEGVTALRPGDITLNFGGFTGTGGTPSSNVDMTGSNSINIQSVSLSLPMSRTPIERLGSRFAFARVTDFPVTATMSINALVNEVQARNLADMIDDGNERDITLIINKAGTTTPAVKYTFKAARLNSESYSSDIGSNKSVDLSFSTQIGGPNDTNHGIYFSGASALAFTAFA
ncbi:MAG: hypothetical protein RLZZ181_105 [Pseudomonadota bacterium]|jgi:hypothetical protein